MPPSIDEIGDLAPEGDAVISQATHSVVDHNGIEWIVSEVATPEAWARSARCLLFNSRECVRRVWEFPDHWRTLSPQALLRLGATG